MLAEDNDSIYCDLCMYIYIKSVYMLGNKI